MGCRALRLHRAALARTSHKHTLAVQVRRRRGQFGGRRGARLGRWAGAGRESSEAWLQRAQFADLWQQRPWHSRNERLVSLELGRLCSHGVAESEQGGGEHLPHRVAGTERHVDTTHRQVDARADLQE